ncbi:hypothetical protein Tco_1336226 [Tanacetum coccineum]
MGSSLILKKFGFSSIRTTNTPMETNKALTKDEDGEDVDIHLYRFQVLNLKASHLNAVKKTVDMRGASLDRKSTTGGCQFLGFKVNSWQCKNQMRFKFDCKHWDGGHVPGAKKPWGVLLLRLGDLVDAACKWDVSTVSAPVSTTGVTISTAKPRTPPTTTVFDDEDVTMKMAQTLIKMKEQKAKEKGVAIIDVVDSSRIVRPTRSITTLQPLLNIDPKDNMAIRSTG